MTFFELLIILLLVSLVLSVVFSLRFLIFKKNQGCGIAGLVYLGFILFIAMIIGFIYFSLSSWATDTSDEKFIRVFERKTDLTFPASGVMSDKRRNDRSTLSLYWRMTITMDSVDFKNILHEVKARYDCPNFTRRIEIWQSERYLFDYTEYLTFNRSFNLRFLEDMRTIRVSLDNRW